VTACQSGTAALHLALADSDIGAGALVVAPALTFVASINPISYVGAEPVFMDCDDSLCVDPDKLEYYLHEDCEQRGDGAWYDKMLNKPVKAAIIVHVFGNMADMERLTDICEKHNIVVIEDAAEAIGTFYSAGRYNGKMAGTIGDYGAFSFNGNKIITTGGGGMITSPASENVSHMRHLSTQAKTDEIYYLHDEIGFNYRMTNIQAAIGLAQLEQLETFIDIKCANYNLYLEHGLELLRFRENCRPNYWFYSYLCPDFESGGGGSGRTYGSLSGSVYGAAGYGGISYGNAGSGRKKHLRDELIRHLNGKGIQTRPVWGLCHEQPMYCNKKAYRIERAIDYYWRIINLPCSTNLSSRDVRLVAEEISAYIKQPVY
jgi:dTDP-4-amino-4,6-dideoxygalactose transaminase